MPMSPGASKMPSPNFAAALFHLVRCSINGCWVKVALLYIIFVAYVLYCCTVMDGYASSEKINNNTEKEENNIGSGSAFIRTIVLHRSPTV